LCSLGIERGEGWACGHCFRNFSFARSSSVYSTVVLELGTLNVEKVWHADTAFGTFPLLTILRFIRLPSMTGNSCLPPDILGE
jgi:hypothetical protein